MNPTGYLFTKSVLFVILLWLSLTSSVPTLDRYVAFARRLLFGPTNLKYSNAVIFDSNQGEINRWHYRRAYGHQGHRLVDAYGKGLSKEELHALGYL
ncbi:hypothetical protein RUM43_003878 [Polyplax serrata]|uniref:Uncharacterized protein n=1 Tax=Polyplax serrata TaxID=468196 RepID=A0AAN8S908_POLSC